MKIKFTQFNCFSWYEFIVYVMHLLPCCCCSITECPNLWDPVDCSTPDFSFHCLPEFTHTHAHWVGDAIQPAPPASVFPSIRVFSNESAFLIRWPKYWSFSFSMSPSNEHPGLISFRLDWLDLLAVQGTLKSLSNTTVPKHQFFGTQHHSFQWIFRVDFLSDGLVGSPCCPRDSQKASPAPCKAAILGCSAFFMLQLSRPYWKTKALTIWTFVSKVIYLLFYMLSRFFIVFLPSSKGLLIPWLQ